MKNSPYLYIVNLKHKEMIIIILYWVFSFFWMIGFDQYEQSVLSPTAKILSALLLGWAILPMSYGSKRAKELDK